MQSSVDIGVIMLMLRTLDLIAEIVTTKMPGRFVILNTL